MNKLLHFLDMAARFSEARNEAYHDIFFRSQYKIIKKILGKNDYLAATFYLPGEIAALYEIPVLYIERISGFAAANHLIGDLNIRGISLKMPSCGCSYQLAFESLLADRLIPPPSGYMASNYTCDDAYIYCQASAIRYDVPFYFIDVPFAENSENIGYVENQLKELCTNLGEKYNAAASIENIVEISNRTMNLKMQIDNLRIRYPGILGSMDSFKLFTAYNDLGQEHTFHIFNELLNTLKAGIDAYSPVTDHRILWLGVLPLYNNSVLMRIEKKYECRIVYEELFDYGNCTLSVDNFFHDLAKRILSSIFFSVDNRAASILRFVEQINIDGIICFSQRNCRFLPPMLPALRKRLESSDIPIIEIQGDAIYPGNSGDSRLWDILDAFFDMIDRRRQPCL